MGLGHRLTHLPGQLSGGEQQRVALARACVAPSRGCCWRTSRPATWTMQPASTVMDLLFELRVAPARTLLLITHDADLAARCDRCVHLSDGRVVVPDAVAA